MWEREENLTETVGNAWSSGGRSDSLAAVASKLKTMQDVLSKWALKEFCSVQNKISSIRRKLKRLWDQPNSVAVEAEIKRTTEELDELLLREEIMWRQRSRALWLREGDKKTLSSSIGKQLGVKGRTKSPA